MIVEFVSSFSKILSTKDFFPGGFTVDIMERALTEKEVAGPLTDIIQMFLNAIFLLQEEEAAQTKIHVEYVRCGNINIFFNYRVFNNNILSFADVKKVAEKPTFEDCVKFATWFSKWARKYHGAPLSKLPMYSLTVSEILRMHLLSSGAKINEVGARWRFQQRGGYTHEDDPGLHLRHTHPQILHALSVYNVVQLNTGDKLAILTCLLNQLLTYAEVRDVIEERLESVKQNKLDLRSAQFAEKKRCAEFTSAKSKLKGEVSAASRLATIEMEKIQKENSKHQAEHEKKVEKLLKNACEHQVLLG